MKTVSFLFAFLFIISQPLLAAAQRACHGSDASTIEVVPDIIVRHTDATETVTEPLGTYLSSHDRGEVMEALTALSVRHHVNCGRTLRVQFAYDERIRRYAANIRVREHEDCWEQVQTALIVRPLSGSSRDGDGGRPLAAILDADAHGELISTAMEIDCPGDTPEETIVEPPVEPVEPPPPDPPPVATEPIPPPPVVEVPEPALCGAVGRTDILYEDDRTARIMNGISEEHRSEVMPAILARLGIICGHTLHIRIARNEMGADYVVHMWSLLRGHTDAAVLGSLSEGEGRVWLDEGSRIAPAMPGGDGTVLSILREIARTGFIG